MTMQSSEYYEHSHDFLAEVLCGQTSAIYFIVDAVRLLHLLDDVYDRDKELSKADALELTQVSLIRLARNEFYRENFQPLSVILENAILNWRISNQIEEDGTDENLLHISYVLRQSYVDLITHSALIIGGMDWAATVGPRIREFAQGETFETYLKEFRKEA